MIFLDSYFLSYGEFGELIMELSRAALRPLLAAHERGALPLVVAAWGVTARNASHNASNARGVAAGKMGRNSSNSNTDKRTFMAPKSSDNASSVAHQKQNHIEKSNLLKNSKSLTCR